MSAKELGQIHTVSDVTNIAPAATGTVARRYDLAGGLSDKLQRMVRQGNFFKLVGIDIAVSPDVPGPTNGGTISGYFRYYQPTKGRCAAFRHAFKAMADQMKMQGIPMRANANYDFRVALTNIATASPALINQSSLDGINGLALNAAVAGASVFGVYNKSVLPNLSTVPTADLFDEGFDTLLQAGGAKTDFVLNEGTLYSGNEHTADLSYERIPFQISYDPDGSTTTTFEWRPDPALYVAVMTGNLEMVVEDATITGTATQLRIETAFYISGWKSIMGNPGKKKTSRAKKKTSRRSRKK